VRTASPGGADVTADQHLVTAWTFEHRLDGRGVGSGADEVGRGAASEEQTHRFDEDGLPGAGLSGKRGEPWIEIDLDGFDHRQVADAKRAQHVGGNPIVSYV